MFTPIASLLTLATFALAAPVSTVPSAGPGHIDLKTAGNFTIIGQSGISSVPGSAIQGNIACSPIAATGLTGFSITHEAGSTYGKSAQVSDNVYAADYAAPTPANIRQAVLDSNDAYNTAMAMSPPDYVNYGGGQIGSAQLTPGLYNWDSGVNAATDFTLSGGPTDTWVFQVEGVLTISPGVKAILSGGARATNIFWAVLSGKIDVNAHLEGIVSSGTTVVINTDGTLTGRAYSQTATTLQKANITEPAPQCLVNSIGALLCL
ncbi:hypothetical protein P7C70_g3754, partial [Phenoliferia sp. Uapishka_3]